MDLSLGRADMAAFLLGQVTDETYVRNAPAILPGLTRIGSHATGSRESGPRADASRARGKDDGSTGTAMPHTGFPVDAASSLAMKTRLVPGGSQGTSPRRFHPCFP